MAAQEPQDLRRSLSQVVAEQWPPAWGQASMTLDIFPPQDHAGCLGFPAAPQRSAGRARRSPHSLESRAYSRCPWLLPARGLSCAEQCSKLQVPVLHPRTLPGAPQTPAPHRPGLKQQPAPCPPTCAPQEATADLLKEAVWTCPCWLLSPTCGATVHPPGVRHTATHQRD